MKIIEYRCNVCSDSYKKEDAFKEIKSCYFMNLKEFQLKDYNAETDRHICKTCIKSILKSLSLTHADYI